MTKENGICEDPFGERANPLVHCKLRYGHKGLHSDQDKTWAGNNEIDQPVIDPSRIQTSDRNSAITIDLEGEECRLPAITYKAGWDFFWWETKDCIGLTVDTITTIDGRFKRVGNTQVYPKYVVRLVLFDMIPMIVQEIIRSVETKIMKEVAFIDDEPLWQKPLQE